MTVLHNLKLVFIFIPILVSATLNPIVLIPGDGGSQLEAKLNKNDSVHYICEKTTSNFFTVWLNLELLMPVVIDCWIDNVRLIYDNATRTTRNVDGVEIRIAGWGYTEPVEWLDPSHTSTGAYFNKIADALVSVGHERNKTLKGAPYDFRKAPNENKQFFVDLKSLIEQTSMDNNNESVILVTHSMGGLMALQFLIQQDQGWKDKFIRSYVTLSTPWGGSVKAVKVYAIGDDLGSYVLRESVMRQEQITSPSLAWLLPSSLFWKPDEVLVQTEHKNFTLSNLQTFFHAINFLDGWEMRKDTVDFQLNFKPPGVEVHCLYGVGTQTVERLYYKPGTWLDGRPTLINGDGDGTVNKRSLEGCLHWQTLQKQKVYTKQLPHVDHMGMLTDEYVLSYIMNLVNQVH